MPGTSRESCGMYAVTRGGGGCQLVFIHGAGGNRLLWGRQVGSLCGAHCVTAIDLRGHGLSSPPGRETIEDYASDTAAFLTAMAGRPAVLVGHSMGGAIALTLALERPELVRGLVLVSTGARLRVSPAVLEGLVNGFDETLKLIGDFAFGPSASTRMRRLSESAMRSAGRDSLLGDFRACDAFDSTGRLALVRVPTLVICGTEDRLTPLKYARFLAAGIGGASLETVPGAGHMVMLERPALVSQAIGRFAASI